MFLAKLRETTKAFVSESLSEKTTELDNESVLKIRPILYQHFKPHLKIPGRHKKNVT